MSTQAVASFIAQLTQDDVTNELNLKGKTKKEGIAAIVQLAGKHGFEFTEEECAAVLDMAKKMQAGQLEDAELETVAGGVALPEGTWASLYDSFRSVALDFGDWLNEDDDDDDDDDPYKDNPNTAVAGVRG